MFLLPINLGLLPGAGAYAPVSAAKGGPVPSTVEEESVPLGPTGTDGGESPPPPAIHHPLLAPTRDPSAHARLARTILGTGPRPENEASAFKLHDGVQVLPTLTPENKKVLYFNRLEARLYLVPAGFLFLVKLRTFGGGLSPMAEKSLFALPTISVLTHIVVERI